MGVIVGTLDSTDDGVSVGLLVRGMLGTFVGTGRGSSVGLFVRGVLGALVGTGRGSSVGLLVRGVVGTLVGSDTVGLSLQIVFAVTLVGDADVSLGTLVGLPVGSRVGFELGTAE